PEVLAQHKSYKKSLGDAPMVKDGYFLLTADVEQALEEKFDTCWQNWFADSFRDDAGGYWLDLKYYRPGALPIDDRELTALQKQAQSSTSQQPTESSPEPAEPIDLPQEEVKPTNLPQKLNVKLVDLASEPDSFVRQRQALLRLARYLKRVPTTEEALQYIQDERLFTGA